MAHDPAALRRLAEMLGDISRQPPNQRQSSLTELAGGDAARSNLIDACLTSEGPMPTALLAAKLFPDCLHATSIQVDGFRILKLLGSGGMGVVYLADQIHPPRRVALKLVKPEQSSPELASRFEREWQMLAAMDHPWIAKVYACGRASDGRQYMAMELVAGQPLTTYCEDNGLDLAARLELMTQLCEAVQHLHHRGVVHRDLTPNNVLVAQVAGKPQIKIIDFGLAKSIGPNTSSTQAGTIYGSVVGTPEYMAPEQADPELHNIDPRADIFSLGVILFEVLTGAKPFPRTAENRFPTTTRAEPPRPSAALRATRSSGIATRTASGSAAFVRSLRTDLDWAVLRALERRPERRYASASALGADLERFLRREPLDAGPPGTVYRLRKLAERYRKHLIAGLAFLGLGAAASLFVTYLWLDNRQLYRKYKHLDLAVKIADLDRREKEDLHPADPDNMGALRDWLREAELVLLEQPAVANALRANPVQTLASAELKQALQSLLRQFDQLEERLHQVRRRVRWAEFLAGDSEPRRLARSRWQDFLRENTNGTVQDALNSEASSTRRDLIPLGKDPASGLWEFYHLRSAWNGTEAPEQLAIPTRSATGLLTTATSESSGIVFVLLPGGRFPMGLTTTAGQTQARDRFGLPNPPVRETSVNPFFIAKHELTQGQWQRLWNHGDISAAPSEYRADGFPGIRANHPVESVSWKSCDALLRQHSLRLPTSTEWEYACRADGIGEFGLGEQPLAALASLANVADRSVARADQPWEHEPWDDGYLLHAPVGRYAPNSFGLHDMHGNVWEWCSDPKFRIWAPDLPRYRFRGGSFWDRASYARAGFELDFGPEFRFHNLGCRAARSL
jgi:serine/threonine protein kinase/formylglycine-generating enzyme required for sulfatase activity